MGSTTTGEWLEKALSQADSGVELDADLISGLVSFCELAPPPDAADYLSNIIGPEAGQHIIQEYLRRRGYVDSSTSIPDVQTSNSQGYVKPPADENGFAVAKKQTRPPKAAAAITNETKNKTEISESSNNSRRKKKAGKAISLAEAAKGSVVFRQGEPCSCQARRHKLVSNCLSCGKIVCEQEGEGPCSFCGALVLREGSTYAGLDEIAGPLSNAEAAAEAYAKRLVDYDRNSAARTTVIDDQSDYYNFEGNAWMSEEEKELLRKKQREIEEAEKARRSQVVVTFDLVGRKVILNKDGTSESESENSILRPPEEREQNRIKPNPTVIQPVFVNTGPARDQVKGKQNNNRVTKGLCLEISGRVQHEGRGRKSAVSGEGLWPDSQATGYGDEPGCSLDYN
ncbi:uncharacterized protein A4U43_C03F610 [Asparagus officinalis]|uniref:Uncharacterized protein n=1 Tax=Asparagus officinalis TaxID=4686 RepID=A0A5P1FAR9_ASPOF|nr:activating signal cointegrator 1 [Asparagus officinalis]ONK73889.1 uncharacterized protein A4U43_C03F610 [Asparagus officinalis]